MNFLKVFTLKKETVVLTRRTKLHIYIHTRHEPINWQILRRSALLSFSESQNVPRSGCVMSDRKFVFIYACARKVCTRPCIMLVMCDCARAYVYEAYPTGRERDSSALWREYADARDIFIWFTLFAAAVDGVCFDIFTCLKYTPCSLLFTR